MSNIDQYLRSCLELARFCSRGGCVDLNSLRYSVIMENSHEIVVEVEFDEELNAGGESLANRKRCYGQLHLCLDRYGRIIRTETL